MNKKLEISIVIPVYNDEEVLDELYRRLKNVLENNWKSYEIVFVDDGSKDSSFQVLKNLKSKDSSLKIIKLARNFGQQNSIAAGLKYAEGDLIALMDSDLQDKPEDLPRMVQKMKDEDADMVIAKWITRKDSFLKRLFSNMFYEISRITTGIKYEKGLGVFRIMKKELIKQVLDIPESTGTILSLLYWSGIDYALIELKRDPRFAGKSGYNLRKMLQLTFDRIFSYSMAPIRIATRLGMILGGISMIVGVFFIFRYFILGNIVAGWTSTMVAITFLFGLNFIFLGIIGEYLGRIYIESKGRPKYIISKIIE